MGSNLKISTPISQGIIRISPMRSAERSLGGFSGVDWLVM
jgi:hypothetical protein